MEVQKIVPSEGDECRCQICVTLQECLPGLEPTPEPTQETLPGLTIPLLAPEVVSYTRTNTFVFENGEFLCKADTAEAAERIVRAMSAAAAADYNVRLLAMLE
jgi:hypothetical protein